MGRDNVDSSEFNSISLFSGGGGLDMGLELAGVARRVVAFVEREAYAVELLASRMETGHLDPAPIFTDVTSFDGRPFRGLVGVVAGGFPCQDISNAGKRAGIGGARSGLWKEYVRILDEVRPGLVAIENVAALRTRGLEVVLSDLASLGFNAEWALSERPTLEPVTPEIVSSYWPTATVGDSKASGSEAYSTESGRHAGVTLTDRAVRLWPTAAARDWKDTGSPAEFERKSPCLTPTALTLSLIHI